MKVKNIFITFFVLIVLVSLLIWSYKKSGATTSSVQGINEFAVKSVLTASSTIYDFGTISMKDGKVTKDFTFTNYTGKDMVIKGVETSCMCTSASLIESDGSTKGPFGMSSMGSITVTDDPIKSGETKILRVVYDPNAHGPAGVGNIDRFITVTDLDSGTLTYEIKAIVTP